MSKVCSEYSTALMNGLTSHVIVNPMLLDASGRDAWITVIVTGSLFIVWSLMLYCELLKTWMSVEELKGIRWMSRKLERTPLTVPLGGGGNAVLMMYHPKMSIKPEKCDPYQLEEALYRKHPSEFKRLSAGGRFFLDEASIRRVKIKVALVNTGRLKGR